VLLLDGTNKRSVSSTSQDIDASGDGERCRCAAGGVGSGVVVCGKLVRSFEFRPGRPRLFEC
jgi:hypothetical protein